MGAPPALVFVSLAFYLLGSMLYLVLSALIFFRWVFRPMHLAEMGASWWINMGAVAIATLAGAQLLALPDKTPELAPNWGLSPHSQCSYGAPARSGSRCW